LPRRSVSGKGKCTSKYDVIGADDPVKSRIA
jgi:hypothetical protein